MKKILTYFTIALAGVVLFAACDKNEPPVFDDANAFVAFNSEKISTNEAIILTNGEIQKQAVLKVPVTLASIKGLSEKVSFEIVDTAFAFSTEKKGKKMDLTAHAGVNFNLLTTSKTLTFSEKNRTQYIEFEVLYYPEYTGDLSFIINLNKPASINLGTAKSCTVTLADIDHPLTAMLGDYTATSTGLAYSASWTIGLYKDADDDHKVWLDNLFANAGWAGDDTMFYGNVDDDLTKIVIPLGQTSEYLYGGSVPVTLFGLYADWSVVTDDDVSETGSTEATIVWKNDAVYSIEFAKDCGFYALLKGLGYVGFASPQIIAVKK